MMALARELLIGRHEHLNVLDDLLDKAAQGEASFAFISGEAGIGKSALLHAVAESADRRGFLVLEGSAAEFELEMPFGIVTDALDTYLRTLERAAVDRLAADKLGELAAVFPALGDLAGRAEHPMSAVERFRTYFAVRDLLERLAARQPLALLLDDAHWADPASLELLHLVMRRPPEAAVAIVLGARTDHGDAAALEMNQALQRAEGVTSIELQPLSRDDVGTLLDGVSGVDVEWLYQQSGGNPFYALELADLHKSGRSSIDASISADNIPVKVARAIRWEVDHVSLTAQACVEAASVLGDPFDVDLVATMTVADEQVWSSIDELVAADLIRPTAVPRRYRFRHPLVRSAVYLGATHSVRYGHHRRAVDVLVARGAAPSATAVHLEQVAQYGDLDAVDVLRRAGHEVADHAPMAAVRWFDAALRLMPANAAPADRIDLLTSLAGAQATIGHFDQARLALEEVLEHGAEVDDEARVDLIVRLAQIAQLLGRHNEGRARLQRAFDELPALQSRTAVSLLISLCSVSLYLSDHDAMLTWGEVAVTAASELGEDDLLAAALAAGTLGAAFANRIDVALDLQARAANMVDQMTDEAIVGRLDALSNLATAELYLDRHVQGCEHGERALTLARATGQSHVLPTLTPILGTSLAMAGHNQRAAEVLDDAIEAARLVGNAQGLSLNLFNRALTAIGVGDLGTALRVGAESVEAARSVDNGVITAFAGAILAQAMMEDGDAQGALELLLDSVGGDEIPLLAGGWRAHFLELMTRIQIRLGELGPAQKSVAQAQELAAEVALDLPRLMADRASAALALANGRPGEAVAFAVSAVEGSERIGAPWHTATSRALAGQALSSVGRSNEAIAQLEQAAAEFERIGALRYRDQVESELRGLGVRVHRRSRRGNLGGSPADSLTGREVEVADLVVGGKTNREIAQTLFLSSKTVESHLRNVFHKLGVSTRGEVGPALQEGRAGRDPARPT